MAVTLPDEARTRAIASLRRYVAEEMDLEIGDLKASLLLDFFLKEVAPSVYNGAVADAQAYVRDRLADLEAACYEEEFTYWPKAPRRG